ncbi:hypothetical protein TNCV_1176851 [Trichonephila clavipes]|nr:hypothetical protein TNCV_1176851 [Trichonephila clavipes]
MRVFKEFSCVPQKVNSPAKMRKVMRTKGVAFTVSAVSMIRGPQQRPQSGTFLKKFETAEGQGLFRQTSSGLKRPLQHFETRLKATTVAKLRKIVTDMEKSGNYIAHLKLLAARGRCEVNGFPNVIRYVNSFLESCQVIYSQFDLEIHQNDHQARRRFVEWAQNEIAVVPDFHKRILFSDEAHFGLNGYVNKQNCRISSEANPQVYVETPLHPEKLFGALYGLVESFSSKKIKATTLQSRVIGIEP